MSEYYATGRGFEYQGCNDCKGIRSSKGRLPKDVKALPACTCQPRWVLFTRRTEDPKLGWLERHLRLRDIPCRRNGASFHAPILEVQEADLERAWAVLNAKPTPRSRRTIDDVPDDHPMFRGEEPCPHGARVGECQACDIAGDLAYDAARERGDR